MKLHKYCTIDRVDILRDGMIRFTQPTLFNDPFELSETVTGVFGADKNPLEAMLEATKIGKLMMDEMGKGIARVVREYYSRLWGVLSLAEEPDDLLMWAHYANEHQGFVIEFDKEHAFFDRRRSEDDRFRRLWKVKYARTRPTATVKEYQGLESLLTKSTHWEYEQEWRMVVPLEESDRQIGEGIFPVHLFALPPDCVTGVILGCRMTEVDRNRILDVLVADGRYDHVAVRQAEVDDRAFELRLPESPHLHASRAEKAIGEEDFRTALVHANRALEAAPEHDKGRYYGARAVVQIKLGDKDAFARDLEKFKELDRKRFDEMLAHAGGGGEA